MSTDDKPCQATLSVDLRQQIMDSRVPKNEREWWASRTIEELERERDRLRAELVATLSVCSAETYRSEEAEHDCRVLIVELNVAKAELATERARVADLVADLNDACITLASAAEDCDDYAMQNTGFKLTAVREVLLQHIPNAAMKEGA